MRNWFKPVNRTDWFRASNRRTSTPDEPIFVSSRGGRVYKKWPGKKYADSYEDRWWPPRIRVRPVPIIAILATLALLCGIVYFQQRLSIQLGNLFTLATEAIFTETEPASVNGINNDVDSALAAQGKTDPPFTASPDRTEEAVVQPTNTLTATAAMAISTIAPRQPSFHITPTNLSTATADNITINSVSGANAFNTSRPADPVSPTATAKPTSASTTDQLGSPIVATLPPTAIRISTSTGLGSLPPTLVPTPITVLRPTAIPTAIIAAATPPSAPTLIKIATSAPSQPSSTALPPVPTAASAHTTSPTPIASPVLVNLTHQATIIADAPATQSRDTCNPPNITDYRPKNLTDGNLSTAWRVTGNGANQTVRFEFGSPVRVHAINLVPGYAKIDPCTPTLDWCLRNRIPKTIIVNFSEGSRHTINLGQACEWQGITLDTAVQTTWVQLTIIDTYPPIDKDFTAISEIVIIGVEQ